jgi:hypothetical protein
MFRAPNIVTVLNVRRLEWLGVRLHKQMVQEEYRNYWKAKQEDRFKKENLD